MALPTYNRNVQGQRSTLFLPGDAGDDPPAASITFPDGRTVTLGVVKGKAPGVTHLAAVKATKKQAAVPARWQLRTPILVQVGEHVVRFGDGEHHIHVEESPELAQEGGN